MATKNVLHTEDKQQPQANTRSSQECPNYKQASNLELKATDLIEKEDNQRRLKIWQRPSYTWC